jgi:hypothetical protein
VRHTPAAGILAAAFALTVACDSSRGSKSATDTLLAGYTAADRANPSPTRPISGINVWSYCQSLDYPTVGYKRGYVEGPQGAYDNWVCQRGTDQLKPIDAKVIDMVAACRWQNKRADVTARPDDPNHAWTWNCYPAGP